MLRGLQGCIKAESKLPSNQSPSVPAEDLHAMEGATGGGGTATAECRIAAQDKRQSHTEEMEDRQAFLVRP